jgi:hypothetical protein
MLKYQPYEWLTGSGIIVLPRQAVRYNIGLPRDVNDRKFEG